MRHLLVQPSQVEFIIYIVFVHLKFDKLDQYLRQIQNTHTQTKITPTSQKNSLPRSVQNHEIQDTSSELLIFLKSTNYLYSHYSPVHNGHSIFV